MWSTGLPKATEPTERVGLMSVVSIAASSPKGEKKEKKEYCVHIYFIHTYIFTFPVDCIPPVRKSVQKSVTWYTIPPTV